MLLWDVVCPLSSTLSDVVEDHCSSSLVARRPCLALLWAVVHPLSSLSLCCGPLSIPSHRFLSVVGCCSPHIVVISPVILSVVPFFETCHPRPRHQAPRLMTYLTWLPQQAGIPSSPQKESFVGIPPLTFHTIQVDKSILVETHHPKELSREYGFYPQAQAHPTPIMILALILIHSLLFKLSICHLLTTCTVLALVLVPLHLVLTHLVLTHHLHIIISVTLADPSTDLHLFTQRTIRTRSKKRQWSAYRRGLHTYACL